MNLKDRSRRELLAPVRVLMVVTTLVIVVLAAAVLALAHSLALVFAAVAVALLVWLLMVRHLVNRYVLVAIDYTRETNRALIRADKLAATGRLAAGIAHEVGNPLSAIATYAQVVRQRSTNHPELREPLDGIEREVERIDRIVRGLLDVAKPRRRTPRPIGVDNVLRETLRLLQDQGVLRRVTVEAALDSENALVFAEQHDLEQVFVNLLLNAVDAMHGAGTLRVRTRRVPPNIARAMSEPRRAEDQPGEQYPHEPNLRARVWLSKVSNPSDVVQIVVADSGPGIPADDLERVFEPFYSTKPDGRGTGLGLAIVAQTVEGLGGTIWAQPAREGGAALVLLLPQQRTIAAPDAMK